jgi:hypothetical protein
MFCEDHMKNKEGQREVQKKRGRERGWRQEWGWAKKSG